LKRKTILVKSMFAKNRMYRLFADDGRTIIVALDHGSGANVYPALVESGAVIEAVIRGGADAILTTAGVLKQFGRHLRSVATILRVDGGNSDLEGGKRGPRLLYTVEDALRLGADAIACMGFPGTSWESETLANLANLVGQGERWGMPVMAEMLPGGFADTQRHTVENIRLAVRIGIELGADLVKTKFAGTEESFRQVTDHAYRPVLVLGGSVTKDARGLFTMVKSAMDAGACGAVIGRNIWGHAHPHAMVRALVRLVHAGASVEEGLDVLASAFSH
jgi:class I fructose-bisphosphate aldolase